MPLRLSWEAYQTICQHAREEYPYECCGALIGKEASEGRTVHYALRLSNERVRGRERRFLISSQQVLMAERQARRDGLFLIGFYHSHPDHPAEPSEYDRQHALPWYIYLIASVPKGQVGELKGWQLREDRSSFDEEEVLIDAKR
ncbi:MAG: M67 family metallopeptidase [candidate division WOR-3 bacterium]